MKQKFISGIKRITSEKALAAVFLLVIFILGASMLPQVTLLLNTFLHGKSADIVANVNYLRNDIDTAYLNMLTFDSGPITNKGTFINFNGFMARVMGQRFMNEIVRLDNGHLTLVLNEEQDAAPAAEQMTELYNRQAANGKDFLFVLAPYQIPPYEDILPAGFEESSNAAADDLLAMLSANGVPSLDLRAVAESENMSFADMFFTTDHHWTPETGFWAYTKIVEYITNNGIAAPVPAMYTDINQYNVEVYEDWFLGYGGKRTGIYFSGVDDFSVITPMYPTDGMSVELQGGAYRREGNFADIAYLMDAADTFNYFGANPYGIYGNGDNDLTSYRNTNAPVDLKIMSIGDSFTNACLTFLPLAYSTCDELDMRAFKSNFEQYYNEYNPDLLIVLVTASDALKENTVYDFFT